ncbi:outer membrane protein assembly factor BamB family protein [[Actinomadura] parvosata]|uniref:outer membrane protein assembly factor BamB family protein n=1 Tax=[Actinomadura] parvosata TaxID=1955412 RepID=UPI00406C0035
MRRGVFRRGAIRQGAILLVVLLASCAVAAGDGAAGPPRVLAAWRAAWSVPTEAGYAVPGPTPAGRAVAVATRQGDVRIHDPGTGALRRVVPAGAARPASVTGLWIAAGTLIVSRGAPGGAEHTLHGHDLATGAALWRRAITITAYRPTLGKTGTYHGPRVLATERGVVVVEEPDEPIAVRALDPRTGAVTARWAPPAGCRLTAAASARSVILLSHCQGDEPRLASLDPGTLRQEWSRRLPSSSSPPGAGPPIGVRAAADGFVHASAGEDDFFYGPDGRLLSTGPQAVPAQAPAQAGSQDRWSAPLYAGPYPAPGARGGIELAGTWPLPAYLISVDTRTGRLGGLPIDVPARLATLAGTSGDLAFVHSDAVGGGRLTAYRLVHERAAQPTAWPDPCALLTAADLASYAPGYRPAPATDGTAKCDWIPPADGTPVVSLSVDWVSPSETGARELFTAEAAAIRQNGDIDPTTESPGFLAYTVATPNGFHGAALVHAGPVIARLTSASRPAVRLLAAALRRNLLARYRPGVPVPSPARGPGWNFPADAAIRTDPVVAGGVVHAIGGDGVVLALDAATGALRWRTAACTRPATAPARWWHWTPPPAAPGGAARSPSRAASSRQGAACTPGPGPPPPPQAPPSSRSTPPRAEPCGPSARTATSSTSTPS